MGMTGYRYRRTARRRTMKRLALSVAPLLAATLAVTATLVTGAEAREAGSSSNVNITGQDQSYFQLGRKPKDPSCFDCHLPVYQCKQFAPCNSYNARCDCPAGFGGDDCGEPECGALSDGRERYLRPKGEECKCKDGWDGINCNLCTTDDACAPMMMDGITGKCYKGGLTVKENFQMCRVTNIPNEEMLTYRVWVDKKIQDQLGDQIAEVTFSCNKDKETCNFQFWVDKEESFYCSLDKCNFDMDFTPASNISHYNCENIQCKCIPDRMMCGKDGSIDLTEFLDMEIKGPAEFSCTTSYDPVDKKTDGCSFSEPNMNELISDVFGDRSILLDCRSAECVPNFLIPGYTRPQKQINKALIAGAISGSLVTLAAVIGLLWFLRRKGKQTGLGQIYLGSDDDESSKLITEHKPASLHFEDISYTVNGKQILTGVHGAVSPGQVMAIMGASGAGKTTFLDILARKNKRGTVGGKILVNGLAVSDDEYRDVIGFVDQEDTCMPTLTVYETILNSALLRLPRDMDFQSKKQRVVEVMSQLGVLGIQDSLIGSEEGERGISGGERRRVSIACELVTSPAILFLDEPTSGLDAYNAYNVVECLVSLAQNYNRTIVFTIHQPRSNIAALFDQLVLLAKGRMVYSGEFKSCQDYFADLGYPCPPGFNIADFLVDLTMHASHKRTVPSEAAASNTTTGEANGAAGPSSSAAGGESETPTRPKNKVTTRRRNNSVRDRQERALFTRKSSGLGQGADDVSLASVPDESEALLGDPDREDDAGLLAGSSTREQTDLDVLIAAYLNSTASQQIHESITKIVLAANNPDENGGSTGVDARADRLGTSPLAGFKRIGWFEQFYIVSSRTWKNLYRNPMLMLTHYAIPIVLAVLCGFLFYGISDDIAGFQNRMGLFFFVLAVFGFSALTSLHAFSAERLLFVRERANGYYSPITYFASKVVFDILPLRLLPPIILGAIVYPMVGLLPEWGAFFKFILVLVLFNLATATLCLFIGIVVKDTGIANLVGSLVMLFSLLMAGLLLNHDKIPAAARWLQVLSIFHYGFEALIVNEVTTLQLIDRKYGLDISVPGATILTTFGFNNQAYWGDVVGLGVFAGVFLVLGYAGMHFLLVERR
ncbi:hypothetical protein Dda_3094 [Drechslerella dactyloides]|uniref:ABC transporter n=1 Tax=Drechslerella dactyloides TaxID=74499 RepID=A0AAD6J568_DREDA|nr:hypothetical protein Dda_3094 [Drechslerella dactyloides]